MPSKEFVLRMRENLENERDRLMKKLKLKDQIKRLGPYPDSVDASATTTVITNGALSVQRAKAQIIRINGALRRMDEGTYGVCQGENCGLEIPEGRLKVRPCTTLCIECKTREEQSSRG